MPAEEEFSITLRAVEWNTVLEILGQASYRVVAPIIAKIGTQVTRQNGLDAVANDRRDDPS